MVRKGSIKEFFLLLKIIHVIAQVQLQLGQPRIELGKLLKLKCRIQSTMLRNATRQWRGGKNNRLLCFNGVTTNPKKYEEISSAADEYTLDIKDTSENDIDCPYSCRVGFEADETILKVTKDNFLQLPNNSTFRATYNVNEDGYYLDVDFAMVFPKPECWVNIEGKKVDLGIKMEEKPNLLYNISLHLKSDTPLQDCGSDILAINCSFGQEPFSYSLKHEYSSKVSRSPFAMIAILLSVVIVCVLVFGVAAGVSLRKQKYKTKKENDLIEEVTTMIVYE